MIRRALTALAVLALAGFALAACGDDDSTSTSSAAESSTAESTSAAGDGETIAIEADPGGELAFTETDISAPAGSDTIELDNQSTTPHNVYVEDADGNVVAETDTVSGDTADATADLEAGTYTFYCGVDGHREAGMEGTLTVK